MTPHACPTSLDQWPYPDMPMQLCEPPWHFLGWFPAALAVRMRQYGPRYQQYIWARGEGAFAGHVPVWRHEASSDDERAIEIFYTLHTPRPFAIIDRYNTEDGYGVPD
jgi:hypothetical protein